MGVVRDNALVHSLAGLWRAFVAPYWPAAADPSLYRPLVLADFSLDWSVSHHAFLFHLLNVVWHAAIAVALALAARRRIGDAGALVAGALFAVHPVHVEAVASVVGRAELLSTAGVLAAVGAALLGDRLGWSLLAWGAALLAKENAAVAPALVVLGWALGVAPRPPRRRLLAWAAGWAGVFAAYTALRFAVLHGFAPHRVVAWVFTGLSPLEARLTGVSAWTDAARLLLVPLTLRVDYSPAERTAVTAALDPRFVAGAACGLVWVLLVVWAWRRGWRDAAFGLGWIGVAYLPVANLFFPSGVFVAERTLYLPSVGLAYAAGAIVARGGAAGPRTGRPLGAAVALLVLLGAVRTALRVPVWRDDARFFVSMVDDSPRSFVWAVSAARAFADHGSPERALEAARLAASDFPRGTEAYFLAARAAYDLGRPALADSVLAPVDRDCGAECAGLYAAAADSLRQRGDTAAARRLLDHYRRRRSP